MRSCKNKWRAYNTAKKGGIRLRKVRQIYQANSQHWVGDGFLVQPLFSHMGENRGVDPFLMLDYAAPCEFPPNNGAPLGVGHHPHKGFETVTIAYQGEVAHRDSTGGGGVIKEGDVQWMTAGAGIVHEEFHSEEFSRRGGVFEMVQLWVNLPAKFKNTKPRYQHLPKERIPVIKLPNQAGHLRIIAGEHQEIKGAADTFTELNVWDVVINAKAQASLTLPATHSLSLVILRGSVTINHQERAKAGDLVGFEQSEGEVTILAGDEEVRILLLSGVPLREPVVGYGPFVMNDHEEIRQAIRDFNSGRFGNLD